MYLSVENRRGIRYRVRAGWTYHTGMPQNLDVHLLLETFDTDVLDQIYEQFLAFDKKYPDPSARSLHTAESHNSITLHAEAPSHLSDRHRQVYLALRENRLIIEENPLGENQLAEQQSQLLEQIRRGLQQIIAEERAEAARIQKVHEKRSTLEKVGAYIERGATGLGNAAWDLAVWAKDVMEVVALVHPVRQSITTVTASYDYLLYDKPLDQSISEHLSQVHKEIVDVLGFDPSKISREQLEQAFEVAQLLYDEPSLRGAVTQFAKDYVKAQHSLEITELAGAGVFEIILTILLAAFTGGVGAVANMAKNTRLLSRFKVVGELMMDFAKGRKQQLIRAKTRGARGKGASFDDLETVDAPAPQAPVPPPVHKVNTDSANNIKKKNAPPVSLTEAVDRLKKARENIKKNGYSGKYTDSDLIDIVNKGELNDRFYFRLIFGSADTIGNNSLGFTRPSGRAPYWATTFDMAENADSDPELLAGLFGIKDFDPDQPFSIAIIDMEKMPPQTERESFIPTYENMASFGNRELHEELQILGADMNDLMSEEMSEKYRRFVKSYTDAGGNIYDKSSVYKYSKKYTSDEALQKNLQARHIVQIEFGANPIFSGNGLTKVTPESRYAKEIGQEYGVVETFTFERDPLSLAELEKNGAAKIIPAKPIKGK